MFGSSVTAFIAPDGHVTNEFLAMTPEQWAESQFKMRYRTVILPTEVGDHFARKCWDYLLEEYSALRSWFMEDGALSKLLSNRTFEIRRSGPIGDGIGWDFDMNNEPNSTMITFKSQVMCAIRAVEAMPAKERIPGNPVYSIQFERLKTHYPARAEFH